VKLSITHGTMLARVNNYSEIIYNSWYNVGKSLTTTVKLSITHGTMLARV